MIDAIQNLENLGSVRDKLNQLVTASNAASTDLTGIEVTLSELATLITNAAPPGIVSMWSGSSTAIPPGWKLCDGTLGTPNLRDRFIVGAGTTYAVNAMGGAATVALAEANLPAHTHTVNINSGTQSANHTHNYQTQYWLGGGTMGVNGTAIAGASSPYLTPATYQAIPPQTTLTENQAHFHNVNGNTGSVGSGTAHENLPPYYALCYVMKI